MQEPEDRSFTVGGDRVSDVRRDVFRGLPDGNRHRGDPRCESTQFPTTDPAIGEIQGRFHVVAKPWVELPDDERDLFLVSSKQSGDVQVVVLELRPTRGRLASHVLSLMEPAEVILDDLGHVLFADFPALEARPGLLQQRQVVDVVAVPLTVVPQADDADLRSGPAAVAVAAAGDLDEAV